MRGRAKGGPTVSAAKNFKVDVKVVLIVLIVALTVLAILTMTGRRLTSTVLCADGTRQTIDMADFETRYFGYSVQFEASGRRTGKFQGKVSPVQLQQVSEALQSANEFRKTLVAGYNSCAITSTDYSQYAARYQALDGLARQIDLLVDRPQLSGEEKAKITEMTSQYISLSSGFTLPTR